MAGDQLLSIHDGEIAARDHDLEDARTVSVDGLVSGAWVGDDDARLLLGGTMNPDQHWHVGAAAS